MKTYLLYLHLFNWFVKLILTKLFKMHWSLYHFSFPCVTSASCRVLRPLFVWVWASWPIPLSVSGCYIWWGALPFDLIFFVFYFKFLKVVFNVIVSKKCNISCIKLKVKRSGIEIHYIAHVAFLLIRDGNTGGKRIVVNKKIKQFE